MGPTPFYGARAEKPPLAHKANEYVALANLWTYAAVIEATESHPSTRDRQKKRRRKTRVTAAASEHSVNALTSAAAQSSTTSSSNRPTELSTVSISTSSSVINADSNEGKRSLTITVRMPAMHVAYMT